MHSWFFTAPKRSSKVKQPGIYICTAHKARFKGKWELGKKGKFYLQVCVVCVKWEDLILHLSFAMWRLRFFLMCVWLTDFWSFWVIFGSDVDGGNGGQRRFNRGRGIKGLMRRVGLLVRGFRVGSRQWWSEFLLGFAGVRESVRERVSHLPSFSPS